MRYLNTFFKFISRSNLIVPALLLLLFSCNIGKDQFTKRKYLDLDAKYTYHKEKTGAANFIKPEEEIVSGDTSQIEKDFYSPKNDCDTIKLINGRWIAGDVIDYIKSYDSVTYIPCGTEDYPERIWAREVDTIIWDNIIQPNGKDIAIDTSYVSEEIAWRKIRNSKRMIWWGLVAIFVGGPICFGLWFYFKKKAEQEASSATGCIEAFFNALFFLFLGIIAYALGVMAIAAGLVLIGLVLGKRLKMRKYKGRKK